MQRPNLPKAEGNSIIRHLSYMSFLFFFILLVSPSPALAIQAHSGLEALYVHQGAHLFYALSMALFAYRIYRSHLMNEKARKFMAIGAVILMSWNLWAFSGHCIELFIPEKYFVAIGPHSKSAPGLYIADWKEIAYYLLKMDHFLCVPALVFFYLGIRAFVEELTLQKPDNKMT